MKTRLLWILGMSLLCGILTVFAATALQTNLISHRSPKAASEAIPGTRSGGFEQRADDAAITKTVSIRQEMEYLQKEIRAAKDAGQAPSPELYRRLAGLSPALPAARDRRLDQGGELCAGATLIQTLPYSDVGTTAGYQNDYNPDCDGSGGTSPDVVYMYTPVVTGSFHLSLCGSGYDTRMFVYAGTCSGEPIACNDDYPDCYPSSDIPSLALTGGITYYIVVDGYGDGNSGAYAFYMEEVAPPPAGDVCGDPVVISGLPFSVENASTCDFVNDYSGTTCLGSNDAGPDAIYSFTLTSVTSVEIILNAHLASPPQESWVMPGILLSDHCPPDANCIAFASTWTVDGFTPLYLSCRELQPGTYYIMIDNGTWFQTCYHYDLIVETCGPCTITGQGGDVEEVAEPFPVPGTFSVNDPDGGCNNTLPLFQTIQNGQTVHGRTFGYTDSISGSLKSDTDWFRFVLGSPATLSCTYSGESWLRVGLLQGPCPAMVIQNSIQSTPCGTRTLTSACLDPGEYYVRISRGGIVENDGIEYDYRASFTFTPCIQPPGRCCYAGTCTNNTHAECAALDGYWDGSLTCDSPCPIYPPNDRCANAGVPATLPATFTGNNVNATNDCPLEGDPQVWHVFTTTEMQCVQIDFCGTENFHSFNPWLYPSCPCAAGVYLDAVDWGFCAPTQTFAGIWRNLPAGTWYLPVTMYDPNSIGDYTIHVTTVSCSPPENDECSSATPIAIVPNGSVSWSGTTLNATASCTDVCTENGLDYSSSGGDVFYSLTLTECRRIALALGTSDMHLAVYHGLDQCCTSPAYLCNDDDAHFTPLPWWDVAAQHPGNSCSYIAAELEAGTYLIRVAKYGNQAGAYTLTIFDNGPCHCEPPVANHVTVFRDDNLVNIRWTTDAASASRGTYRIYANSNFMPAGDPSWSVVADNITPVIGVNHLYYSAPWSGNDRQFYYVTGMCTDIPPAQSVPQNDR